MRRPSPASRPPPPPRRRERGRRGAPPARNWRAILGFRRADALWLRDRLLPCAALVAVTAAFMFLLRSPRFVVHQVRVVGAPAALTTAIIKASGISNQNLFALNPQQLQARIGAIPDLKQVTVRLRLPDALTIEVTPYRPVAVWVSGATSYLVTEDGTVIKPGDDPQLLHVRDASGQAYHHGDHLPTTSVRAAFTLRDLLAGQHLEAQDFSFLDAHSLSVRASAGWQAVFDVTGDVSRQVQVLTALLARGAAFQYVDLRYGNEPYYR